MSPPPIKIDHLAEIIDEFLTLAEAGVPMSATTRQKYAAEMAELRGHRAQLRKTLAAFWVQISQKLACGHRWSADKSGAPKQ